MNLMQTKTTYSTYTNAEKALAKALFPLRLDDVRYIIAATADGRYAPALIGAAYIPYAVLKHITVLG